MGMSEKAPTSGTNIERKIAEGKKYVVRGEEFTTNQEQEEKALAYALEHPVAVPSPEMPAECAEKITSLERLFSDFEQTHDLNALLTIDCMTVDEARAHVGRQAARADLPPIISLVNYVESQMFLGVISEEAWKELYARYCAIQRAIGTLNGDFLVHDRP